MSGDRCWIALSLVPDIGPVLARKLISAFGDPENVFNSGMGDLLSVKGITRERAENIKGFSCWDSVDRFINETKRNNIQVVGFNHEYYPAVLKETEGAPIVLYMKGEYQESDRFGISVVGSRKNTAYGEAVARRVSYELASAGFTIISGMARGIDTLAHQGALAAGGRTIAVLGSGLDVSYPAENKGLMERIAGAGCVISEFVPGTMPNRENFPRRNRLISGLSLGVVVVEATSGSGSLITAQYALEQNREVFAVPGNITSVSSEGTNRLIKQGARILLEPDDVIEELAPVLRGFIKTKDRKSADISDAEGKLCGLLSREPKHIDLLSREHGQPVHRTLELLLALELKGVVRQSSGKRFYLS